MFTFAPHEAVVITRGASVKCRGRLLKWRKVFARGKSKLPTRRFGFEKWHFVKGNTVMQWLALLPQSKKGCRFNSQASGLSVWILHLLPVMSRMSFVPGAPASSHSLKTCMFWRTTRKANWQNCKSSVGVRECECKQLSFFMCLQ